MNTTKKVLLSLGVIAIGVGYVVFQYMGNSGAASTVATNTGTTPIDQQTTGTPPPTPAPQGQYKDGSYTGSVADAFYGPIQVKATISGGKLTDVQFLQYPNKVGHTLEVSQSAMPILKQEAIAAQGAKVNTISGATQTVDGFVQSLTSALAQAKA